MTNKISGRIHSFRIGEESATRKVVFLHGLFGRGRNFSRIAQGIVPEAQSLLIDLPNHGQSEWTEVFDYEEIADLIAKHLREGFAQDAPVDVVGHSMGGKVAMVLALRHPDVVRRLVVIDISPIASAASHGEFGHLLSSLASLNLVGLEERLAAHDQLRTQIPDDTVRGFLLQNLRRRGDGDGFEWEPNLTLLDREIEAIMGFPDIDGYEFSRPVLWIRGSESDYVQDQDSPAMRRLFPKARRLTVRGAGHWVHSERPDDVIAALRAFLVS